MTMTMTPGSVALTAGAVTCASTLATATAMPAGNPVSLAIRGVSSPAFEPSSANSRPTFSSTTFSNAGSSARK